MPEHGLPPSEQVPDGLHWPCPGWRLQQRHLLPAGHARVAGVAANMSPEGGYMNFAHAGVHDQGGEQKEEEGDPMPTRLQAPGMTRASPLPVVGDDVDYMHDGHWLQY